MPGAARPIRVLAKGGLAIKHTSCLEGLHEMVLEGSGSGCKVLLAK